MAQEWMVNRMMYNWIIESSVCESCKYYKKNGFFTNPFCFICNRIIVTKVDNYERRDDEQDG